MLTNKGKPETRHTALGLDIGGTRIKSIAFQRPDIVRGEFDVPSRAKEGPDAVRKAIDEVVNYFKQREIKFESIGIGCAGSVDGEKGVVRNSPNFASWKNVPLRALIEEDFGIPVVVDNDANCAVFGEWKVGAAAGYRNVVLLTLGTGIGGGLIINDQLFRGSTGTGGELGHYSIHVDGKQCPCGNKGCFERYCSGSALQEASGVTPRELFTKASTVPEYQRIIRRFIDEFSVALTSLANMFDPDLILLGGAVSEGVNEYMAEIESWVRAHAFPAIGPHIKFGLTKHGNLSGSIGAALLSLMDQRPTA